MKVINKGLLYILVSLLLVIPIGFFTKSYTGPASAWVQDHLGGLLYVVFWCLAARLVFRKANPLIIAGTVLVATCCLEVLQLWHPPFLEIIRSTFLGRTLIGTTFSVPDFPYYVLGAVVAWVWLRFLTELE